MFEQDPAHVAHTREEIRSAHAYGLTRIFKEAWNHRDPDALAALFDKDAEFVNVTGLWWRIAHAGTIC